MHSLHQYLHLLLGFLLLFIGHAQSAGFVQYLNQVVTGLAYPVSWDAAGASVTVNLLQNGQQQQTLYIGSGTSFMWPIEDDADESINYSLQLVVSGATSSTITSGAIWDIEDEDGLQVNGQLIYASIAAGPASSGLASATSTLRAVTSDNTAVASNTLVGTVATTLIETATFTEGNSIYTFTTTVSASKNPVTGSTSLPAETLTFTSAGATFITTISATANPTSTRTPDAVPLPDGLSGSAIAGIVIAVLIVVAATLLLVWLRRRHASRKRFGGLDTPESPITAFIKGGRKALGNRKIGHYDATDPRSDETEEKSMLGNSSFPPELPPSEVHGSVGRNSALSLNELAGQARHEMNTEVPRYELAAADVERVDTTRCPAMCVSLSRAGTSTDGSTSASDQFLRSESVPSDRSK